MREDFRPERYRLLAAWTLIRLLDHGLFRDWRARMFFHDWFLSAPLFRDDRNWCAPPFHRDYRSRLAALFRHG
jgi:hypothetical protein